MFGAHSRSRRRAGLWFVCVGRLTIGGFVVALGACRAAPPAPPAPVRLAVGYQGDGLNSRDAGVPVLVAQIEDETLVRMTAEGHFEPALAERFEKSADGLLWTFHLRPKLTFQDGTPIDAKAAAAGLRNARATSSPVLNDVVSIETQGPLDLAIRLHRPSIFVLNLASVQAIRSPGPHSAGAGAFRVVSQDNSHATLSAVASYYRGKPAIDQVEIETFKGGRNAWSALMRGEIDFLYEVTPDANDFVRGSSSAQVKQFLRPYIHTLGFNLRHPVLRQRVVRQALNLAIDRAQVVKEQFGGHAEPAASLLWPKHWAYDATQPGFTYAPQEAARLLDAAGLRVKPAGKGQMPSRFRFTCLVPAGDARFQREGLLLQRQLIELGIDMQIEAVPSRTLVNRLATGQYEAFLYQMLARDLDLMYMFWHSPEEGGATFIDSGYRAADEALDRVRASLTDDQTRAALADLERTMHDDPPAVPLCWEQMARAVNGRFRLPDLKDGDMMWRTLWQWQPATDRPATPTASATR